MRVIFTLTAVAVCMNGVAAEYFVATNGCDEADGSAARPWRTIQRAADVASAGDTVTIRGGVYREWVKPANAGRADAPITYRAAKGEKVVVTGADHVRDWTRRPDGLWTAKIRYDTFGGMNPFTDYISGDWFRGNGRKHPRTRLIHDGKPLVLLDRTVAGGLPPIPKGHAVLVPGIVAGRIVAAFERDPNDILPELVVRPACFYPVATGRDYITVRGITFRNAGPNWAPPTSEQVGVVGTNWSRGWTIEDCEVSGASCTGITLGKYGDEFDNIGPNARHYHNTIMRAVSNGLDRVGHHIVRRCRVTDCGQAGICGSLGAVFSQIEDCEISYCHWRKPFTGDEMAGIKIHGAVDFTIKCSRIHHCGSIGGIWLDWMAQGTRLSGNILWENDRDLYFEVNHGPILVEGNDLLSSIAYGGCSQNIAFVGNRIRGKFKYQNRPKHFTPVFKPHSVTLDSLDKVPCGSGAHVFVNNILTCDPKFVKETYPSRFEVNWTIPAEYWKVDESTGEVKITPPAGSRPPGFKPVDVKRLGKPVFVDQEFTAPLVYRPKMP